MAGALSGSIAMLDRSEIYYEKVYFIGLISSLTIRLCAWGFVASENLSAAADSFEIQRRVVFYDSIQGKYLLSIEGLCPVESTTTELEVTCKVGVTEYKKHFWVYRDNVTWFCRTVKPH